jgi:hypothetical protein
MMSWYLVAEPSNYAINPTPEQCISENRTFAAGAGYCGVRRRESDARYPRHQTRVKTTLYILGGILVADLLFVAYFWVLRAEYYFPGRYEDAFVATFYALLVGLPVLGAFVALLIMYLKRAQGATP